MTPTSHITAPSLIHRLVLNAFIALGKPKASVIEITEKLLGHTDIPGETLSDYRSVVGNCLRDMDFVWVALVDKIEGVEKLWYPRPAAPIIDVDTKGFQVYDNSGGFQIPPTDYTVRVVRCEGHLASSMFCTLCPDFRTTAVAFRCVDIRDLSGGEISRVWAPACVKHAVLYKGSLGSKDCETLPYPEGKE